MNRSLFVFPNLWWLQVASFLGRKFSTIVGGAAVERCLTATINTSRTCIQPVRSRVGAMRQIPAVRAAVRRIVQKSVDDITTPTRKQLLWHALNGAVPFIGFGMFKHVS